jgi:hypothetical protein
VLLALPGCNSSAISLCFWNALSDICPLQVIEAADLASYLADVARTGLEYLDGQYVDTANKARKTNPSLPEVPAPRVGSTETSEAHNLSGARDSSSSQAPLVAGLREAGAAVQSGKEYSKIYVNDSTAV